MDLYFEGEVLDKKKTIGEYGIVMNGNKQIIADKIPEYMFNSREIVKKMKINGEWVFDEEMAKNLGLLPIMEKHKEKYGESTSQVMTAALVEYLKAKYPNKINEYKLIYLKAERFLKK